MASTTALSERSTLVLILCFVDVNVWCCGVLIVLLVVGVLEKGFFFHMAEGGRINPPCWFD